LGAKGSELSAMKPTPYGKRFLDFMKSKVFNVALNTYELKM
jgi:hypothetical protein